MAFSQHPASLLGDPALRVLLEAGGVWLWDTNLIEDTTVYQEGFWEQYGYDPDSATETFDFLRLVENEDKLAMSRAWRAHLDGATPAYESEWRLRLRDGERRWISARGMVIERTADGTPARMVGTYRDITEAKESSVVLAESEAELDAVFRSSRDGLTLIAPDLTVLRTNNRARELVRKFSQMDLAEGESILKLPQVESDRPVIRDIELALAGNANLPLREVFAPLAEGWFEFSYTPVSNTDGTTMGVAVTLRDVTERKRMEQTRLQALRLESMGLMAGGIAHDFNNLLAVIVGNIELAKLGVTDSETSDGLDEARTAAQRASELVKQLLAFAAEHEPILAEVELSALTGEIIRYARRIPGKDVTFREELAPGLPPLAADATQLRQLVLNLLVNAIEASDEARGEITVRTHLVTDPREVTTDLVIAPRPAAAYLVLQVSDNGAGMSEATRSRIFEPFYSTKPQGHGLGLATVLGAVRTHGGTVAVESTPGSGARFSIFLPTA